MTPAGNDVPTLAAQEGSAAGVVSVVLVRPWVDAGAETSCCGGRVRDSVCLVDPAAHGDRHAGDAVADLYRRLRAVLPDADVQIVSSTNSAYLVPWTYRASRRRGLRPWPSVRRALVSTRAGTVLVDGVVVGDIDTESVDYLVSEVAGAAIGQGAGGRSS